MSRQTLILDGYNVIHRLPELERLLDSGLENARSSLIRKCSSLITIRGDISMCYIIFDGSSEVLGGPSPQDPCVRAIFTRTGETADSRIIAIVHERRNERITVVSDDNFVRGNARAHSCDTMSVAEFGALEATGARKRRRGVGGGSKTGLTPQEEQQITNSLLELWKE